MSDLEEGDRRQQGTEEQEMMSDIEKADREVLKRVLCGATTEQDYGYLAARLGAKDER
jgi:hypothetical protein